MPRDFLLGYCRSSTDTRAAWQGAVAWWLQRYVVERYVVERYLVERYLVERDALACVATSSSAVVEIEWCCL